MLQLVCLRLLVILINYPAYPYACLNLTVFAIYLHDYALYYNNNFNTIFFCTKNDWECLITNQGWREIDEV